MPRYRDMTEHQICAEGTRMALLSFARALGVKIDEDAEALASRTAEGIESAWYRSDAPAADAVDEGVLMLNGKALDAARDALSRDRVPFPYQTAIRAVTAYLAYLKAARPSAPASTEGVRDA